MHMTKFREIFSRFRKAKRTVMLAKSTPVAWYVTPMAFTLPPLAFAVLTYGFARCLYAMLSLTLIYHLPAITPCPFHRLDSQSQTAARRADCRHLTDLAYRSLVLCVILRAIERTACAGLACIYRRERSSADFEFGVSVVLDFNGVSG